MDYCRILIPRAPGLLAYLPFASVGQGWGVCRPASGSNNTEPTRHQALRGHPALPRPRVSNACLGVRLYRYIAITRIIWIT